MTRHSVPFFAKLPDANDVRITGDFTRWTMAGIPLWNDGHGSWTTMLPLKAGVYEYRMLIDGDWADHDEARVRVSNPFGGENCILTVS
jgi:1,4-alpha-glucan branching enzyme